jgi:hypothetical protein
MWVLILFFVLCATEFGIAYFYWKGVEDYVEIGKEVGGVAVRATPMKYKRLPLKFVAWVKGFKKLLWVPVALLLLVNWFVAVIVGGIIELILMFF